MKIKKINKLIKVIIRAFLFLLNRYLEILYNSEKYFLLLFVLVKHRHIEKNLSRLLLLRFFYNI